MLFLYPYINKGLEFCQDSKARKMFFKNGYDFLNLLKQINEDP